MSTFMNRNEALAWDRCRFYKGMNRPNRTDIDRVNAVLKRADGGDIFYPGGLKVSRETE